MIMRDGDPRFYRTGADFACRKTARPRSKAIMSSDRPKKTFSPKKASREDKQERRGQEGRGPEAAQADNGKVERIAKRLARAGVASRRDAEALIEAGRVTLNGKVLDTPAVNVGPSDNILLDGKPLPAVERTRLFLFHKPAGLVTTNRDPEGRKTVFDVLPEGLPRLITVGRLDINTEGLLVLTNDGGLARTLELPSTGWLRRYRVRVHGKVDAAALEGLKDGIAVDGVFYGAIEASLDREQGSNAWLTIGLREGKNREVKNVLGALGLDVTRLIRISYGPFQLGMLEEGAVQEIKGRTLREQLGERLISEAGADFEAPIATPFSNKPVRAGRREEAVEKEDRRGQRSERPERSGGQGGFRNRKSEREDHREEMRGRLQTKPGPRGEDRERRESPARHNRGTHVWMAPGARPLGKRKAAEAAEAAESAQKEAKPFKGRPGKGAGQKRFGGDAARIGGKPGFAKRPRPEGERAEGGFEGRKKPFRKREEGEGRRDGDRPFAKEGGRFSRGDKPRFERGETREGGRPPRRDGDQPRAARTEGDRKPFAKSSGKPGGKPFGKGSGQGAGRGSDKPGARPGNRPGGRPPRSGKPRGER
ncbi:pseudouridine synthase, Rsu [Nitratireductor indicus C115]|uniref:Pseudouridine synthase n=2 Tax=Nitratireductor indicus TaxID=721133 RepID=K2NPB0_9HYPH|nr:pseudouridine synthase, Rsu [Nitratireductor indicus C115]